MKQFIVADLMILSLGLRVLGVVSLQLYWNRSSAWVFSRKFAAYFQSTFSGWLLMDLKIIKRLLKIQWIQTYKLGGFGIFKLSSLQQEKPI